MYAINRAYFIVCTVDIKNCYYEPEVKKKLVYINTHIFLSIAVQTFILNVDTEGSVNYEGYFLSANQDLEKVFLKCPTFAIGR